MSSSARSKAEAMFTATQKKTIKALNERETSRRQDAEQVARLRALRLAKEAADKDAAAKEPDKKKKPSRSRRGH